MTVSSKIRILLINAEGTHQDDVSSHLNNDNSYVLRKISPNELPAELTKDSADLVIVDLEKLEDDEQQILSGVRGQAPLVPMIVVSHELGSEAMRQLFKYNVQDWLNKPINGSDLIASVRSSVRSNKASKNRVHAVVSAVGGAGATTTVISMVDIAVTKLFRKQPNVALFDLDFSTGNCSYVLNMINGFDIGSVVSTPRRIDAEFIRVIQQKHEKGFYLYSFKRPELAADLNGYELVLRLLDAVNQEHEHTFLDVPYYETEWKDDVLSAVNTCTVVTEMNLPALKHTLDIIARIRALRDEDFTIRVIVNKRASSLFNQRISKRKLKELFGETPFFFLPLDTSLLGEAMDRGLLPSEISTRSSFTKSLTKYMKSIELMEEVVE